MLRRFRAILASVTIVAVVLVGMLVTVTRSRGALAYVTTGSFSVSDFATGFLAGNDGSNRQIGPSGLAFDSSGNLFVIDYANSALYKFGSAGGNATDAGALLGTLPGTPAGLAFDKQGHLYVTRQNVQNWMGDVVEVDPSSGAIIRTVASGIPCASGIATDPMSGNLFVSSGGCSTTDIWRVSNFASGTGTVSAYLSSLGTTWELMFVPNGTLFASVNDTVQKILPTGPSATQLAQVTSLGGFAAAANPSDPGQPPYLLANRLDGVVTKVDLTTPAQTDVINGGTRGSAVTVGPDGCLYATQSSTIAKVMNADGTCSMAPTSPWDTTPPQTSATLAGSSGSGGWYNGPVTVTLAATDPDGAWNVGTTSYTLDGALAQTYAGPVSISDEGKHVLSFWSSDKAGNVEAKQTLNVNIDKTAPATTASAAPAPNASGWNTSAVTVTLSATDNSAGSGVARTYYALDDPSCTPSAVASCATYSTAESVSADGAHTLTYFSQDNAGNMEAAQTLKLQIDKTAPTIAGSASPGPNANGWNNTDVTVSFTCGDGVSGVASCSGPTTLTTEGANQSVSGIATNNAGNSASVSVGGINIDKTPPTISYVGNAGTYTVDQTVNITCSAADTLSGVVSDTCQNISGPAYSFKPDSNTYSATATDKAGNVGTGSTSFAVQVTYRSLCALTQQFETAPNRAASLCIKLLVAQVLADWGITRAVDRVLDSYVHEVNVQTGKTLTTDQADTLVRLVQALYV